MVEYSRISGDCAVVDELCGVSRCRNRRLVGGAAIVAQFLYLDANVNRVCSNNHLLYYLFVICDPYGQAIRLSLPWLRRA